MRENNVTNVEFAHFEIDELPNDFGVFDAIVARRVLMYQADPVKFITRLSNYLCDEGVIVFQEHDFTMTPVSLVQMPLHAKVQNWLKQTVKTEGADVNIGFKLHNILTQAGFEVETVKAEAIVQTPTAPYEVFPIVRAMLQRIVNNGVATEEEIEIETLDRRLKEERLKINTTYIGDMKFGAWGRRIK